MKLAMLLLLADLPCMTGFFLTSFSLIQNFLFHKTEKEYYENII